MNLNKPLDKKIVRLLPVLTFIIIFILTIIVSKDPAEGGGLGYIDALIAASFSSLVVFILVTISSKLK